MSFDGRNRGLIPRDQHQGSGMPPERPGAIALKYAALHVAASYLAVGAAVVGGTLIWLAKDAWAAVLATPMWCVLGYVLSFALLKRNSDRNAARRHAAANASISSDDASAAEQRAATAAKQAQECALAADELARQDGAASDAAQKAAAAGSAAQRAAEAAAGHARASRQWTMAIVHGTTLDPNAEYYAAAASRTAALAAADSERHASDAQRALSDAGDAISGESSLRELLLRRLVEADRRFQLLKCGEGARADMAVYDGVSRAIFDVVVKLREPGAVGLIQGDNAILTLIKAIKANMTKYGIQIPHAQTLFEAARLP